MKVNTILKAGSLLFNVVQDEKIRELAKIAHDGAKRRGLLDGWQTPSPQHRIPFSPSHYRRP